LNKDLLLDTKCQTEEVCRLFYVFQKERHGLIPFCPIYKLEAEPMIAVQKAAARAGIDFSLAESILQQYVPGIIEGAKP
jgi:hypothetical protein